MEQKEVLEEQEPKNSRKTRTRSLCLTRPNSSAPAPLPASIAYTPVQASSLDRCRSSTRPQGSFLTASAS